MKDSGFDIAGLVPILWGTKRLRFICAFETGNQDTQDADEDGAYPFYVRSPKVERSSRYTFYGEGILMAGDGAGAGRIFHHAQGRYAVHQRVYRMSDITGVNSRFLFLQLSTLFPMQMDKGSAQSTVPSVRLPMLKNFPICLPDLSKQQRIADYLDARCAELDKLRDDILSQIETLEQYKRSSITEAVTKGLNSKAETKATKIRWVQQVPQHWEVVPSKYVFANSDLRKFRGDIQLTSSQKYGIISQADYMERENAKIVLANYGLEKWKHVEPNDFIISLRSFQGGLEMSEVTGCITWHYVVLKAKRKVFHRYFKWLFKSAQYIDALQKTCNFIRDGQDLRYSNFAQVPLIIPPLSEQQSIADYLDSKCSEIDAIIATKKEQLETLAAYRKSLIYEYVTGKKEVPA